MAMATWFRWVVLVFVAGVAAPSAWSQDDTARREQALRLATELPIADAHFHFMLFMKPEALRERLDRHNIRWVVSAGGLGSTKENERPRALDAAAHAVLGDRFLPSAGLEELYFGAMEHGRRFYTDPEHAARDEALRRIDSQMGQGPRTISETFPNAEASTRSPVLRLRVPTDGPFFVRLFEIATRHGQPLPMHMEWHPESVAQLDKLLATQPTGKVVLSHCGKTSEAEQIRLVMARQPNLYCDLVFRGSPQEKEPARVIYWGDSLMRKAGIKPEWRQLIEDYPDRFMIGIDDVHSWKEFDEVAQSLRLGVLAHLTPATAEKVAWRNTVRLYRLKEDLAKP